MFHSAISTAYRTGAEADRMLTAIEWNSSRVWNHTIFCGATKG